VDGSLEGSRQLEDAEAIDSEEAAELRDPIDCRESLFLRVKKENDEGRDEGSFQLLDSEEPDSVLSEAAFMEDEIPVEGVAWTVTVAAEVAGSASATVNHG